MHLLCSFAGNPQSPLDEPSTMSGHSPGEFVKDGELPIAGVQLNSDFGAMMKDT